MATTLELALLYLIAAVLAGLPVAEYTALQVKQSVVGNGHAKKEQVQHMVRRLLALPGDPSPDAADALARRGFASRSQLDAARAARDGAAANLASVPDLPSDNALPRWLRELPSSMTSPPTRRPIPTTRRTPSRSTSASSGSSSGSRCIP